MVLCSRLSQSINIQRQKWYDFTPFQVLHMHGYGYEDILFNIKTFVDQNSMLNRLFAYYFPNISILYGMAMAYFLITQIPISTSGFLLIFWALRASFFVWSLPLADLAIATTPQRRQLISRFSFYSFSSVTFCPDWEWSKRRIPVQRCARVGVPSSLMYSSLPKGDTQYQ